MSSEDLNVDLSYTPPEMRRIADKVKEDLLAERSRDLYMKAYTTFTNWRCSKNVNVISENVLLAYFQHYASGKKASTMWAHYSMLKSTIRLKENIDISKYFKLIAFLKRQNVHYIPKKSSVFTSDEITTFITKAPDAYYIAIKAVLVIGVAGACRCDELSNFLVSDLNIKDDLIVFNIRTSKNGTSRKFVITDVLWLEIITKYLKMRPTPDMPKLFISIRNGKGTRQNIGHNTIGQMPRKIATFLNLQNPGSYTGHTFRRTSATILASRGGNILQLKQHGGWKSSNIAESYIEDSISVKSSIAQMVQGPSAPSANGFPNVSGPISSETVQFNPTIVEEANTFSNTIINLPTTSLTNSSSLQTTGPGITMTCHNCTINYYFAK